jgi:hypothetical protein
MATRRFEVPWPGEPQWTPCPHAPPTYLHISLPLVSNCSPFISPPCYTYIHSQPTFFYPKNPPNCIPILPCPLPYHFAFLDHLWSSPCYQHPPLPLHIHLHCLSGLSTPCLIHPIPLPLPAPLPPFSLFLADLWTLFACIFILSYLYMYIHDT